MLESSEVLEDFYFFKHPRLTVRFWGSMFELVLLLGTKNAFTFDIPKEEILSSFQVVIFGFVGDE